MKYLDNKLNVDSSMNWKELTISDLRLILSEKETEQLNEYSLNQDLSAVIDSTISMVSDTWRGALKAKGYKLDNRPHYIPDSYRYYVLVHARHAVWTRFPNSETIALDDRRKEEYDEALKLLENPFIDVPEVDDPAGQDADENAIGTGAGSVRVPLQRFSNWYTYDTAQDLSLSTYL